MRYVLLILLSAIVFGCSDTPVYDESSRKFDLPATAVLKLNKELIIPPDKARVYFQGGRQVGFSEIDHYLPNCDFEIKTLSDKPQTIMPDEFRILREVDEVVSDAGSSGVYALLLAGLMFGDTRLVEYTSRWYLQSLRQPDVYRLNCLQWGESNDPEFPSVADIRATLGDVFTLEY